MEKYQRPTSSPRGKTVHDRPADHFLCSMLRQEVVHSHGIPPESDDGGIIIFIIMFIIIIILSSFFIALFFFNFVSSVPLDPTGNAEDALL